MSKNLWRCRCGRRVEILTDDNFGDCGCSDPVYGPEYFYMTTECADMLDEMDKDYSDQAKQLAEARAEIEQLKQLWSCNLDIIGGELNKQLAEARAIVAQQKKTFVAALQNATAISASQLRIAEQLKSESSPEMLESERAANATLTEELEKALAEIESLKREQISLLVKYDEKHDILDSKDREIERLQARDGSAKIHLLTPTREDPFRRETLKKVDFGVADNCYVVESETLQRKDALIQQMRQALEWALTEARSTHGETLIQDALAAERKSQT